MMQDERGRKLVAAAIAGLIGLAGIAALVKADHDRDVAEREARMAREARQAEPARRTLDADYEAAARRAEPTGEARPAGGGAGTGEVGPAIVGPKRVGPKIVGPRRVGPKIVGPKAVTSRHAAPARTTRWHGGGGGKGRRTIADHIHYPPGWTRTPNQAPGRRVEDRN